MEAPELQLIECASKADSGDKSHDIGVRQKTVGKLIRDFYTGDDDERKTLTF